MDILFERIARVLKEKDSQGVEVRVLYDAMGCRSIFKKYWKSLNEAGIETEIFWIGTKL